MEAHGAHPSSIRINDANSIIASHRKAAATRAADNIVSAIETMLADVPGKVEEELLRVATEGEDADLRDIVSRASGRVRGPGVGGGGRGGKRPKSRQEIRARQIRARGGDENLVAVFERRADDPKSSTGIFEGSELKERGRLGRIPPAAAEEGLVKVQTRVVGLRDGGGDGILQIVGVGSVKGKWREGIGGIWKGTTARDLR